MKKVNQKVKWNLSSSVSASVDAVVPPFYIVVCSDRNHEDRPTGRRPHGAENPCICHILNKLLEKRRRCLDLEPLEDRCDVRLWQEGKCHYFSDVLVNGVIRSIRML